MKRIELEHIIRAAGAIAESSELVIVGSQSILGAVPNAPGELTLSHEADTYPLDKPERAGLIDGSIGEGSPFHLTFGYYAHGVSPETAKLPSNWMHRAIRVQNENTSGISGLCISPGDLAVSKLLAGREKDLDYVAAMLKHKIVSKECVQRLLQELPTPEAELVTNRLHRLVLAAANSPQSKN